MHSCTPYTDLIRANRMPPQHSTVCAAPDGDSCTPQASPPSGPPSDCRGAGDVLEDLFAEVLAAGHPNARHMNEAQLENFTNLNRKHFRQQARAKIAQAVTAAKAKTTNQHTVDQSSEVLAKEGASS